ncbi:hypothetical protein ILYODFUR_037762 [Ilyodon furcidens]|uniref:Uncharacterized protein n=1 Tax=Ilyodon furcidens TaxID=33524 RepID=A0ABV0TRX3_9TELE
MSGWAGFSEEELRRIQQKGKVQPLQSVIFIRFNVNMSRFHLHRLRWTFCRSPRKEAFCIQPEPAEDTAGESASVSRLTEPPPRATAQQTSADTGRSASRPDRSSCCRTGQAAKTR